MRQIVAGCGLTLALLFLAAAISTKLAVAQDDASAYQAEVSAPARFSILHSFTGGKDGGSPYAGLVSDAAGNLYGTTELGGDLTCNGGDGCGTVFKIDKAGKETVLQPFKYGTDGAVPVGDLLLAGDRTVYGTTSVGGTSGFCQSGCGTVFKIDKTGKETVLYSFKGAGSNDGSNPRGGLAQDAAGNLYGTTMWGGGAGTRCTSTGCGVAFKLDKAGHETVLHAFNNIGDVGDPTGDVVLDAQGNLYGTGWSGGSSGKGGVFKINKAGNETLLYSFTGGNDGGSPQGGIVQGKNSNLYGTASSGGTYNFGVVFQLTDGGAETVLYAFGARPEDAVDPYAAPVLDSDGNLYGTTWLGGYNDMGTVFKIDKTGKETILHSFDAANDGGILWGRVSVDSSGNVSGVTLQYGKYGYGVVFKISPGAQ